MSTQVAYNLSSSEAGIVCISQVGHPLSLSAREAGDAADDERVDDGDDGDRHEPEDAHLDHIQHVERRLVLAQDRALATSVLVLVVSISVLVLRNGLAYTPLTATTAKTTRQLAAVSRGVTIASCGLYSRRCHGTTATVSWPCDGRGCAGWRSSGSRPRCR